jgi:hypothetical protein
MVVFATRLLLLPCEKIPRAESELPDVDLNMEAIYQDTTNIFNTIFNFNVIPDGA